ncbi:MAG: hypothetical protein K0R67_2635 [Paenibacillus sp.]|jgi:hypothetical protein|nr:hypothetical protein [Paenibacillus sp.]
MGAQTGQIVFWADTRSVIAMKNRIIRRLCCGTERVSAKSYSQRFYRK